MEKEGLIHIIKIKTDGNHRKRKFRWVNFYSISLCVFILFIPLVYLLTNIDKIVYSIKPYSVLDFEKLDTSRPKGTICPIENDRGKVVNQAVIFHDNQVDIYDSYRFDKILKTINLPGIVEQVKCMYDESYDTDISGSAKIGFINKGDDISTTENGTTFNADAFVGFATVNEIGFSMAIVYQKDGKRILRRMCAPIARFTHWNYMNGSKRDYSKEELWLIMAQSWENSKRKEKNLPEVKIEIDEHPKNPFEYLKTDWWLELKDRKLLATDTYSTYLTSDDGKILYYIDTDKIIKKIFTTDKPTIWSYCYEYEGHMDIIGFDGRTIYKPTTHSEYPVKFDTNKNSNLEKSSICTNTVDKIMLGGVNLIWNGSFLICYDENSKLPIYKINNLKPTSSTYSFFNTQEGVCKYIWQDHVENNSKSINFEVKMASTLPFSFGERSIMSFIGTEIAFAIVQKKPVFLMTSDHRDQAVINLYNTKHIDEPVTDFYATVENGRPVFYMMNDRSIYRWENSTDSMNNLKPEAIKLDNLL